MAIAINYLKGTATTTNAASYALGTCTPSGTSTLVLAAFVSTTVTTPGSVTGWGLTWSAGTVFGFNGGADSAYLFYANLGTSAMGTATMYVTGDNGAGAAVMLWEVVGGDTASPIRQIKSVLGTAGSPTLTLGTAPLTVNGLIGAYGMNRGTPSGTAPSGWTTADFSAGYTTPSAGAVGAHDSTPDGGTVITFTSPTSGTYGLVVAEFNVKEYGYFTKTADSFTLSSSGSVIAAAPIIGTVDITTQGFTLLSAGTHGAEEYVSDLTIKYPSGATGSAVLTLDNVTVVSSGSVPVIGSLSKTLASATLLSAGSAPISGSLVKTLAGATIIAAGSIPAQGTANITLGNYSLAGSGSIECKGTVSSTLSGFTLASTGSVGSAVCTGSLISTLDSYTVASSGSADLKGYLVKTLANSTVSSSGSVEIKGNLGKTLANFTVISTGVQENEGELTKTLGNFTLLAAGNVSNGPTGSFIGTLQNATLSAAGTSIITGNFGKTLNNATLVSSGSVPCIGTAIKTLGNFTVLSSGSVPINGSLVKTAGNFTLSSTGSVSSVVASGSANITLSGFTVTGAGTSIIAGQVIKTLDSFHLLAAGTQINTGSANISLGSFTVNAQGYGVALCQGVLIAVLSNFTTVSWGVVGKPYKHKMMQKYPVAIGRNNIIYRKKR